MNQFHYKVLHISRFEFITWMRIVHNSVIGISMDFAWSLHSSWRRDQGGEWRIFDVPGLEDNMHFIGICSSNPSMH